jgi:hypothetical protein
MNTKAVSGIVLLAVIGGVAFWFLLSLPKKPTFQGHTMAQWLTKLQVGTNSIDNSLEIVRITKVSESRDFEFEVPLSYDLLKKNGFLEMTGRLYLISDERILPTYSRRAANGNFIFGCDVNDFTPGTNKIKVQFFINNPQNKERFLHAEGPAVEFISSNICHVNPYIASDFFKGVVLHADLCASNASYSIELQDDKGDHVKTISGSTSNGVVNERWDLLDDSGKIYSYHSFNAIYRVTIPHFLSQTVTQNYIIQPE